MFKKDCVCFACALRMALVLKCPPPQLRALAADSANALPQGCTVATVELVRGGCSAPTPFVVVVDEAYTEAFCVVSGPYKKASVVEPEPLGSNDAIPQYSLPPSSPYTCVSCGGVQQYIRVRHAPSIAQSMLAGHPYLDCINATMSVAVPRQLILLWCIMAAKLEAAQRRQQDPPSGQPVDSVMTDYRDSIAINLRGQVHTLVQEKRPNLPFAVDGDDLLVDTVLTPEPRSEALLQCLPENLLSNRGDGVLTWEMVVRHAVPWVLQGWDVANPPLQEHTFAQRWNWMKENVATLHMAPSFADMAPVEAVTTVSRGALYVTGSYCKYRRDMSQSPWFTGGHRVGSQSLQEAVAKPILPFVFPNGIPPSAPSDRRTPAQTELHRGDLAASPPSWRRRSKTPTRSCRAKSRSLDSITTSSTRQGEKTSMCGCLGRAGPSCWSCCSPTAASLVLAI